MLITHNACKDRKRFQSTTGFSSHQRTGLWLKTIIALYQRAYVHGLKTPLKHLHDITYSSCVPMVISSMKTPQSPSMYADLQMKPACANRPCPEVAVSVHQKPIQDTFLFGWSETIRAPVWHTQPVGIHTSNEQTDEYSYIQHLNS